ncbi:MAG: ribbon-helix-helix protein, CopG family [Candidatus Aminicenantes bacterium]|nr:ribbon-helix-helix protein, CopG family [Candidatus Aminicenantes bacterium]
MNTNTVNISFKKDLLKKIDKLAKAESRSRSELIREAARLYIERRERWEKIFDFGLNQVKRLDLKEEAVAEEIKKYR